MCMGIFSLFDDVVDKIEKFEKAVDSATERLDSATDKVSRAADVADKKLQQAARVSDAVEARLQPSGKSSSTSPAPADSEASS